MTATALQPVARRGDDAQTGSALTVFGGDSITEVNSSRANNIWGDSWATYMVLASGGRACMVYNTAKGGDSSLQIATRWPEETGDRDFCNAIFAIGTNDRDANAQTLDNIEGLILRVRAKGGKVGLNTAPPSGMQNLPVPTGLAGTPVAGGSTLATGDYQFVIFASSTTGTTAASAAVTVTIPANGSAKLTWDRNDAAYRFGIAVKRPGDSTFGQVYLSGPGTANTLVANSWTYTGASAPGSAPGAGGATGVAQTQVNRDKQTRVNAVIHRLADRYGLTVCDQYSALTDWTASGQYQVNGTSDGTHPTPTVQKAMGVRAWAAHQRLYPERRPYLVRDDLDSTVIVAGRGSLAGSNGGLLNPNTVGDALPSGWSLTGSGGYTSTLTTDPNVPGYVYTLNCTDYAGKFATSPAIPTAKYRAGDLLSIAFLIKSSGLDAIQGGSLAAGLKASGGASSAASLLQLQCDTPTTDIPGGWAIWWAEAKVPPGTTAMNFSLNLTGPSTSASIAQLTIRNLTALGLG